MAGNIHHTAWMLPLPSPMAAALAPAPRLQLVGRRGELSDATGAELEALQPSGGWIRRGR